MKAVIQTNEHERKEIMTEDKFFLSVLMHFEFEGDVMEVAEKIKSIPDKFKAFYPTQSSAHRFSFRKDREWEYGDDGSHDIYILRIFRWETDDEMKARLDANEKKKLAGIEKNKKQKAANEKRQRALFESLKKKFEP